MDKDKLLAQLIAVVSEMQQLCSAVKHNTMLDKTNAALLKRHTGRVRELLIAQGIERYADVIEENQLLTEQNEILLRQRETDVKTLERLQEKLDALGKQEDDQAA